MAEQKPQSDKFKEAARKHDADLSVRRWEDKLRKVAKAKPEKSQ